MAGALSYAVRPRRRFDSGGPVTSDTLPVPPVPPNSAPGSGAPLQQYADTADDGLLAAGALSPSAPQSQDPNAAWKSGTMDTANKRLDAMAILAASGMANPSWGRPGATNLPMLAAAAGMLAPTRTGGFAESLGNALGQAAGATEQQRQLEAQNQMRLAQLGETAAYREGILGVRGQHEQSYADRAATYNQMAQARSAEDQARAAYLTARASMAGASHATEGDILNQGVRSLADGKTVNPQTGQPWTTADAYRYLRGYDIRQQNADASTLRAQTGVDATQARIAALQQASTDRERALVERSTDADLSRATSIMNSTNANGGHMSLHDALGQVQTERPNAGMPPAARLPSAPAAGGTQPPAPAMARPAQPAQPMLPPRPAWVPPGSAYSPSRNAWRDPTGAIFSNDKAPSSTSQSGQ